MHASSAEEARPCLHNLFFHWTAGLGVQLAATVVQGPCSRENRPLQPAGLDVAQPLHGIELAPTNRANMAAELVEDIGQLQAFLRSQRGLLSDALWNETAAQHRRNLLQRIHDLPKLGAEAATELTTVLTSLPFSEEGKQELSAAVSDAVLRTQKTGGQKGVTMQQVHQFGGFFSTRDVEVLQNPDIHSWEKREKAVQRCLRVGLIYPTESSSGRITATAVVAGLAATSHDQFLQHVQNFKNILKRERAGLASRQVTFRKLPSTPQALDCFAQAYGDEDPPQAFSEADVEKAMVDVCALRKNHKKVSSARRGDQQQPLQLALTSGMPSSSSASPFPVPPQAVAMQAMCNMLQGFMQYAGTQSASSGQGPNMEFSLPVPKRGRAPKAILDRSLAGEPAEES